MIIFSYYSIGCLSIDCFSFSPSLLKFIPSTSRKSDDLVFLNSIFSSSSFDIYFWALVSWKTILLISSSFYVIFCLKIYFSIYNCSISFKSYLWSADDYLIWALLLSLDFSLSFSLAFYLSLSFYFSFCLSNSSLSSFSMSLLNYLSLFWASIFLSCSESCS